MKQAPSEDQIRGVQDLIAYTRQMCEYARDEDAPAVLDFCNRRTRKRDVEAIIGRELSVEESSDLLNAPENMDHAYLRDANMLAFDLQQRRATCRRLLRLKRLDQVVRELDECARMLEGLLPR